MSRIKPSNDTDIYRKQVILLLGAACVWDQVKLLAIHQDSDGLKMFVHIVTEKKK